VNWFTCRRRGSSARFLWTQ